MVTSIPGLGVVSTQQKDASLSPNDDQHQQRSACSSSHQRTFMSPVKADDRDVHVYTHPKNSLGEHAEESEEEVMFHIDLVIHPVVSKLVPLCTIFLPFLCIMFSTLQNLTEGYLFVCFSFFALMFHLLSI